MKAKMTITKLELRNTQSTRESGRTGHSFELVATLKVTPRSMGIFSGEDIDCPHLLWIETVDWYRQDANTAQWFHAGTNPIYTNLYETNPTSNTFRPWSEEYRYAFARETNGFPTTLKNASERDVKYWIACNGFEWELPITDRPSMGLQRGVGGGAGVSLVTEGNRRRVIRFELGFTEYPHRIHCAQILETTNGIATINSFIPEKLSDVDLNNQQNWYRWRESNREESGIYRAKY